MTATTNPGVTPADVEAAIASEHYVTAQDGILGSTIQSKAAVDRFLTWPVPASVHPDGTPGRPGRTGTNLLSAPEARAMLDHVCAATEAAPPLGLLTFCVLVTTNGHTVSGEAHCQDPAKFDAEIGRQTARANAIDKLWPMVVYAKRQALLGMAP